MASSVESDRIPLSRPEFGPEEEAAVVACLRSGWVSSGPQVAAFEAEFAARVGCEDAVATSSGTAALDLALRTLDLQPGDEVITPSLTWVSLPNLVTQLGGRPVFCDVDPETMSLDLGDAERIVGPRTRAIAPMHYAGRSIDLTRLHEFARSHGLAVIEDAAHAIGGRFAGRPIGSHSGLVAFSFHPSKNITTCEGGMLTGLDRDRLARARALRYHGVTRDTFRRHANNRLPHYDCLHPGVKYIMTDMAAAVGSCQLRRLDAMNAARTRIAAAYRAALAPLANRLWIPSADGVPEDEHVWHLFVVRVPDQPGLRDQVMQGLLDSGIGVGLHYRPVHELTWVGERGWRRSLPATEQIGRTAITLPMFPSMTDAQVSRVADALARLLDAAEQA